MASAAVPEAATASATAASRQSKQQALAAPAVPSIALHDFTPKPGQRGLPFRKGDVVEIIEQHPSGWWKARCGTQLGWAPSSLVRVVFDEAELLELKKRAAASDRVPQQLSAAADASADLGRRPANAVPAAPGVIVADDDQSSDDEQAFEQQQKKAAAAAVAQAQPAADELWVVAQFDYDADEDDELSFKKGDRIRVLERGEPDGWWSGELNGELGLFAASYVNEDAGGDENDDDDDDEDDDVTFVIAQHDYEAEDDDELTFEEGDQIKVLEAGEEGGWWSGEVVRTGDVGLFPHTYIKRM